MLWAPGMHTTKQTTVLLGSSLLLALCACGAPLPEDGASDRPAEDTESAAAVARRPFPQHVAYRGGALRPSHLSQAQLDGQVLAYYHEWRARYLAQVPGVKPTQKYVFYNREGASDPRDAVAVSEGHGYGMLITALVAGGDKDAKADFDALYRFYQAHPSVNTPGLMAWQQVLRGGRVIDNPSGGNDSATDGDLDIAYALLLADRQWGSAGAIDYKAAALRSMAGTLRGVVHKSRDTLKLGDWAADSDSKYGAGTRPSDFMLDHLIAFAAADPAHAARWRAVYDRAAGIVNAQARVGVGLLPDFMVGDGSGRYAPAPARFLEGKHDGDYDYNACRTPWRLAMADLLHGRAEVRGAVQAMNRFFIGVTAGHPDRVRAGYHVSSGQSGSSYVSYSDLAFVAPLLVGAMTDPSSQAWLNGLWDRVLKGSPIAQSDYYGNTIKMLVLLVASGNFWAPV